MEQVTARVTPSIVNVEVTSRVTPDQNNEQSQLQGLPPGFAQFFGQGGNGMRMQPSQPQVERGIGSGVIISPDGYIVTNDHVVDGATKIRVTLNDRRVFTGHITGVDKLTDLAVIKIDAKDLRAIAWGDSSRLEPGQTVLAFGSPFGSLRFSVTRGIVSALNRANPFNDDARKPGEYIQTDAAINPGNSGGALVNAHGELIGINQSIITNSGSFAGAGFAIPSQTVEGTTKQLIAHGKVDHGYLGISMNDVTPENARFFNLAKADGAIVAQVTPDSPAARGGVKQGDVITSLNGQNVLNGGQLQVVVLADAARNQAPAWGCSATAARSCSRSPPVSTTRSLTSPQTMRIPTRTTRQASPRGPASSASPWLTSAPMHVNRSTPRRACTVSSSRAFARPVRQKMLASSPAMSSSKSIASPQPAPTSSSAKFGRHPPVRICFSSSGRKEMPATAPCSRSRTTARTANQHTSTPAKRPAA